MEDEEDLEVLGEQLYDLIYPKYAEIAGKLTGMLLEQHKEAVLHLLSEPSLLEEQVNLALKTLQELGVEETDVSDSSDADDTERLEERLFLLVQEMNAAHSNDIT
ncbi:unnamed protein product, partial [Coregonus sp. 'balchen']